MTLLPCPVCNSPVKLDSTAASEMYGHAWQTLYVTCTQTNDEHCAMSLNLEADFDYIEDASDALAECWNILARDKK